MAVLRIAAELEGSVVTWPGRLRCARAGGRRDGHPQRLSGGDYAQDVFA